MTVCTAALAERNTLIGVSDRMLTAGDIEFEPEQAKFWVFSTSILALIAGDISIQGEIFREVDREVKEWIKANPDAWVSVKDIAVLYCKKFRELRKQRAEAAILEPLGLSFDSFLANQSTMHSELVSKIADQLVDYEFPSVLEAIFMGIDNDGPTGKNGEKLNYPQLYVTTDDKLSWLNTVGFAAIGIGKSHAESQFMFSGHWPQKPFAETLLLTYAAKKRAEAAPGVGKETDVVMIGPRLGESVKMEDKHLKKLDAIYQKSRKSAAKGVDVARQETISFVDGVRKEYANQAEKQN